MRIGIVGSFGTAHEVVAQAVAAEEHGWDGFFTWDGISVLPADTWDPWAILAAAAVRTRRITLGAMVFALPRRKPWEVARQALTIDHLSGGRLVLPVGLGAIDDRAFSGVPGQPVGLRDRAELLDDALAFLDRAWSGEPFDFAGSHIEASGMHFLPRPVQRPRIPVWVVASWPSEKSMGRAARWDGVVPQPRGARAAEEMTPEDLADAVAWLRARDLVRPFEVIAQGVLPTDPDAAAEHLASLADAGATWWIESRWDPATTSPQALLRAIEQGPPAPRV